MGVEPLPLRQRWTTALDTDPATISSLPTPLLRRDAPIAVIGGALAAALIPVLAESGFQPVAAERRHPILRDLPGEEPEYEAFGNGYGEIHSARAFRQLAERAARTFAPTEDRWPEDGRVIDPFRPNLRYPAASDREFDVLQERHLNTVRAALRRAGTVLVALSTSEVWESRADGAVFPHWAGDPGRRFDPERHGIRALTVEETVADLTAAASALRALNADVRIVLMISPEPQPATASPLHVVAAATLGKAVLRIAAETVQQAGGAEYFPALEIAGLDASWRTFAEGGAVPEAVVRAVARALLAVSEGGGVAFEGVPRPVPEPPSPSEPTRSIDPASPPSAERPSGEAARSAKVTVVDPFTIAKAAEEKEREAKRAAKLETSRAREEARAQKKAALEQARADKATALKAERAKAQAEKKAALEAKLAERSERNARLRTAVAEKLSQRKRRRAATPGGEDASGAASATSGRAARRRAPTRQTQSDAPTAEDRALRREKMRQLSARRAKTATDAAAAKASPRRRGLADAKAVSPEPGATEPSGAGADAPKKRPRRTPPAKR